MVIIHSWRDKNDGWHVVEIACNFWTYYSKKGYILTGEQFILNKSLSDVIDMCQKYQKKHKKYHIYNNNCRKFIQKKFKTLQILVVFIVGCVQCKSSFLSCLKLF